MIYVCVCVCVCVCVFRHTDPSSLSSFRSVERPVLKDTSGKKKTKLLVLERSPALLNSR